MTCIPTASWGSINSHSKRSIKVSRLPGCSVYCLHSTAGQQSREGCVCFELSPFGAVITHLSIASVEMENAEAGATSSPGFSRGPLQAGFGQINITLDSAQGLVVDGLFVTQFDHGVAFRL